jgi:hypothetical protein
MGADKTKKGFDIQVNFKPVHMVEHQSTGLAIKEAAIAQGVDIQPAFILTLEGPGHQQPQIFGDTDTVEINKNSEFIANDGDDNS